MHKQYLLLTFLFGLAIANAQTLQFDLPDKLLYRLVVLKQSLLVAPTVHDYMKYDFDWDFIDEKWDSLVHTNVFATEENGQLVLYMYSNEYDEYTQDFSLSEYTKIFGLNEQLGNDPFLVDAFNPVFFADSLYVYLYNDDKDTFVPGLIGYLTQHPNGKLESFEVYVNSTGVAEPPFELLPFISLKLYYDNEERIIAQVNSELDLFDLIYYADSTAFVWNKEDQLFYESTFVNDTLTNTRTNYYTPGNATSYASSGHYYDAEMLIYQDSVFTDFMPGNNYTSYLYERLVGSSPDLLLTIITVFEMYGDTSSLVTHYRVDKGGNETPFYEVRTRYDDTGRTISVLERSNFPFDELTNDFLIVFVYPDISAIQADPANHRDFEARISDQELTIDFDREFTGTIRLFTSVGETVNSMSVPGSTQVRIDMDQYPAGIYFGYVDGRNIRGPIRVVFGGE